MHKFIKTLALLGFLAPMGIGAVGIGDLRVYSALNQALDAEIRLILTGSDSLDDIRVSLASPEAFARAGLERHHYLTRLRFDAVRTADGAHVIKVSSREAIREPFLSFLVEINSSQGRMLHEFDALLDPPSALSERRAAERSRQRHEAPAETRPAAVSPVRPPARKPPPPVPRPAAPSSPSGPKPASQTESTASSTRPPASVPSETDSKSRGVISASAAEMRETRAEDDLSAEVTAAAQREEEDLRSKLAQFKQDLPATQRRLVPEAEQAAELPPPPEAAQPSPPAEAAHPPETATPPTALPQAPAPPGPVDAPPVLPDFPEESGFLYPIFGGGAIAAGLAFWWLKRRRQVALETETESILFAAEPDNPPEAALPSLGTVEAPLVPLISNQSSFLSEFTPSDFDVLSSGVEEVDPLSEADVYLAYGRYEQAEELVRQALVQHPERDEYKLKLLEIYQVTENRAAFEEYARELKTRSAAEKPGFWAEIEAMGRELMPDSPLFQGSSAAREPKTAVQSLGNADAFQSSGVSKRLEPGFAEPAAPSGTTTGLIPSNLEIGMEPEMSNAKSGAAGQYEMLNFDIGSLDFVKDRNQSLEQGTGSRDFPELENLIAFESGNHPVGPLEKADLRPKTGPANLDRHSEALEFDLELFESDLDGLNLPAGEEPRFEGESEAAEDVYADLTDMDRVETKLNLAKAYADMEDRDSAREILHEVLVQGNERQKTEAGMLLKKLGNAQAVFTRPGDRDELSDRISPASS